MTRTNSLSASLACMLMIGVVGCGSKQPAGAKGERAAEGPVLAPPQSSGDATNAAKIKASFASLSTEDRVLAEKQKICPVSDEPLGTMGAPKKVSVAGHDVFICCQGCEKELTGEPDKYLAKLGIKPAK